MNIIDAINNGVITSINVDPYELHIYEDRNVIKSIPVDIKIINNEYPLSPQDVLFINKTSKENDRILINKVLTTKYNPIGSTITIDGKSYDILDYSDIKQYGGKYYANALVRDLSNLGEVNDIDTHFVENKIIESLNNMIMEDNKISSILPYYNKFNWMKYISDTDGDGLDTADAYDTLLEIFSIMATYHDVLYEDYWLDKSLKELFEKYFTDIVKIPVRLGRAQVTVPTTFFVLWLMCKHILAPSSETEEIICPICEKKLDDYNKTKNDLDTLKIVNKLSNPFGIKVNRTIYENKYMSIDIIIETTDDFKYNYLIRLLGVGYVTKGKLFDVTCSEMKLFSMTNKDDDSDIHESILVSTKDTTYSDPDVGIGIGKDYANISVTDGEYKGEVIDRVLHIIKNDGEAINPTITKDFSNEQFKFINIDLTANKYITKLVITDITNEDNLYFSFFYNGEKILVNDYSITIDDNGLATITFYPIYTSKLTISSTGTTLTTSDVICYGYSSLKELTINNDDNSNNYTIDNITKIINIICGNISTSDYPYDVNDVLMKELNINI